MVAGALASRRGRTGICCRRSNTGCCRSSCTPWFGSLLGCATWREARVLHAQRCIQPRICTCWFPSCGISRFWIFAGNRFVRPRFSSAWQPQYLSWMKTWRCSHHLCKSPFLRHMDQPVVSFSYNSEYVVISSALVLQSSLVYFSTNSRHHPFAPNCKNCFCHLKDLRQDSPAAPCHRQNSSRHPCIFADSVHTLISPNIFVMLDRIVEYWKQVAADYCWSTTWCYCLM